MSRAARAGFLAAMLAFCLGPIYWELVVSLKGVEDPIGSGNPWWPEAATAAHYSGLLHSALFGHWMLNTLLVVGVTILVSLVCSLLAAYALAFLRVPLGRGIVLAFLATYLLPQGVLFVPLGRMMARLHLTDSPGALMITYPSLVIPFATWVLWSLFRSLPGELLDHARLEGAGLAATFRHVLLPLSLPAVAAVSLFAVAVVFNDFLYAFTFLGRPESTTLMGGIGAFNVDLQDPGFTFAAILLGGAPPALLCAFFADTYARGLGAGFID